LPFASFGRSLEVIYGLEIPKSDVWQFLNRERLHQGEEESNADGREKNGFLKAKCKLSE